MNESKKFLVLILIHFFLVLFWPILIGILFFSNIVVIKISTIVLALEISLVGILVPLGCYSVMIREMVNLDDKLDFWFVLMTNSKIKPRLKGYALVKLYWYYGRFEDAHQIIQGKKESEILNEETPSTVKIVWGWKYYQDGNLLKLTEILKHLLQKGINFRDEEDRVALAVIGIWIAVLKNDQSFEPLSHQDDFRAVYEMDRAYWCGHLYELLGEESKAIEEFQIVWLNGQWSLRAKEAKKYLGDRNISLKTPEKYKSKAFRNYVSYMIHSWGGLCVITLLLLFVSQLSKP